MDKRVAVDYCCFLNRVFNTLSTFWAGLCTVLILDVYRPGSEGAEKEGEKVEEWWVNEGGRKGGTKPVLLEVHFSKYEDG